MNNNAGGIAGKVALVTGSSRGIGAAIAQRLAAEGASVAVHGRDEAAVAKVRGEIEAAGGRAIGVLGDVIDSTQLELMRQRIEAELGTIDILVANAGGTYTMPGLAFEDIPEDAFRRSIDGNLIGTFLTIKSVLPGMKERRSGRIVTISSSAGRRPHPRSPIPYAVAKAAIQLLTQDLATQVGAFGIRANCIAPETIVTESIAQRMPAELQATLAESHPVQRLGTPDDVAAAVVFLASDESGWITGHVLDITGGALMV